MDAEPWLSPKQVAELLSVSRITVLRAIKSGRLKATRLSPQMIRVAASEVERFVRDGRLS